MYNILVNKKTTPKAPDIFKEVTIMLMPSIFQDNFFDDMFDSFLSLPTTKSGNFAGMMQTDVKDNGNSYELEIALPGYKKEDLRAELKDGYLTINAEHAEDKDEKDKNGKYIRKERYTGHCSRSFYVGENLKQEDIKAKFENGLLLLEFPKEVKKPELPEKQLISIA